MNKAAWDKKQTKSSFRVSSLAFAIHVACVGIGAMGLAQSVSAQTLESRSYHIPAGSLASVLNTFAEQAGTTIAIDTNLLKGKSSSGLTGQYDVESGFQRILAPTEFVAAKVGSGYMLKQVTQAELKTAAAKPLNQQPPNMKMQYNLAQ